MNTFASTAAGTRVLRRPAPPRRVSGPARPAATQRLVGVADARVLDRLIRGRAWIAVIGFMLMGLVFVQVSMLQLNTGIGRDVASAAKLERANQQLRNQVAELGAGDRIQAEAQRLGMVMPAAGQVHYLQAGRATASAAAAGIGRPAPVVQTQTAPTAPTVTGTAVTATPVAAAQTAPAVTAAPATTAVQPAAAAPAATTAAAPAQQSAPVQQQAQSQQQSSTPPPSATGGAAPTP